MRIDGRGTRLKKHKCAFLGERGMVRGEKVHTSPTPLFRRQWRGFVAPVGEYFYLLGVIRWSDGVGRSRTGSDKGRTGPSPIATRISHLTSHHSHLTSHLSPLTSRLSPLASHHSPLTSRHSPLSSPIIRKSNGEAFWASPLRCD